MNFNLYWDLIVFKNYTFIEGFRRGFHSLNGEWDESETVARNGVANFVHNFGNGDKLVGTVIKLIATFNNGVSVHNSDGYTFGGLAAIDEDSD